MRLEVLLFPRAFSHDSCIFSWIVWLVDCNACRKNQLFRWSLFFSQSIFITFSFDFYSLFNLMHAVVSSYLLGYSNKFLLISISTPILRPTKTILFKPTNLKERWQIHPRHHYDAHRSFSIFLYIFWFFLLV